MNDFWLYPEDDEKIFFEICKDFEEQYPEFQKSKSLRDVDDSLVRVYEFKKKKVVIILERVGFLKLWQEQISTYVNFQKNGIKPYRKTNFYRTDMRVMLCFC